jgi:ribosomal subunit interface protein
MHTIITGVHIDVTDAISSYVAQKMSAVEKLLPSSDTSVKLSIELLKTSNHHAHGDVYVAGAQLHVRGKEINCKTQPQDDLYKAVDVLKDMLTRELASYKDKERSIFRRGAQKVKALFKGL